MDKISVIGIGKLGICSALLFEKGGYDVLGVDVDKDYVSKVNSKLLNSSEEGVEDLLLNSTNFKATTEIEKAVEHSDFLFVVVPTPSNDDGSYNHGSINAVFKSLSLLADMNGVNDTKKHIIICSTVMPGYINSIRERMADINYTITYNPEFIAQGTIIKDMKNPDIILIGETDKSVTDKLVEVYGNVCKNDPQFSVMSPISAEITKIALNCYITTKIAFANAIGDLCLHVGAEEDKVLDAVGGDSRVGNKYFKYGYGYGGPCFPRDNRALGIFSKRAGREMPFSKITDKSNKIHLQNQVEDFCKSNQDKTKEVVIDSVSYKKGSDIIEESQKLLFASELVDRGYNVKVVDSVNVIKNVKEVFKNKFTYEEK